MVHTLEISRVINEETFNTLIKSLNCVEYDKKAWRTEVYADKGVSRVCLCKFKPKRKNLSGEYVELETEPYQYIVLLTINPNRMLGGEGYSSTNVLSFTPPFLEFICDNVLKIIPTLEINSNKKKIGQDLYRLTGERPEILNEYYNDNTFKLRRIDYAFDIISSSNQYMQLVNLGEYINKKAYKNIQFKGKSKTCNLELFADDIVDEVIDDEEPDFEQYEDLLQEYIPDKKSVYYKSKSVNINIYLKGEHLREFGAIPKDNHLYDFLRIEIQVKKNKLNYINRKHGVHSRDFCRMPIPEYEYEVLKYYTDLVIGSGHYLTFDLANKLIENSSFSKAKKTRLKKLIELISKHKGTKNVLDKVKNEEITELGKLSTVKTYLREIQRMGINPVTISRNMKNTIPKVISCDNETGEVSEEVLLCGLVEAISAYNEQIKAEQETDEHIKKRFGISLISGLDE